MVNNGFFIGKGMDLSRKHHTLCVQVPLFHIFGTDIAIMVALNHASTVVLPTDGYHPSKTLDAIKNEKYLTINQTQSPVVIFENLGVRWFMVLLRCIQT